MITETDEQGPKPDVSTGRIILKSTEPILPGIMLEIEQELNNRVASEIYAKYKVGLRIHLG